MLPAAADWLLALYMFLRVLLAALLAGLIGYEREYVRRSAGLRTHILVAAGAALVMCCGEFLAGRCAGSAADPARLGAQVVSGVGFLCAGAIIKEGASVRGLTTASSLWCVACVGLACGCGCCLLACAVTALIYIVLRVLRDIGHSRRARQARLALRLTLAPGCGLPDGLEAALAAQGLRIESCALRFSGVGRRKARLILRSSAPVDTVALLHALCGLKGLLAAEARSE
ncbi:MAG: MgtC/SapB family protein [Clostridia bacterium]|nr:MgtC/SapB family protein [Clostridia bacterium]